MPSLKCYNIFSFLEKTEIFDVFYTEKIKNEVFCPLEVKIFDLIDSTNAEARRIALGEEWDKAPVLILAYEQSAGRGRLGRSFQSRRNEGIFMSLLYYTAEPLHNAVSVTTVAAVFVAEAIEGVVGGELKIKWVNDIYNENGKVCGILTESVKVSDGYAIIVGIGINTGDVEFPEELRGIAASVGDVFGKESEIVGNIASCMLRQAAYPTDREYMAGYRKRFMLDGADVVLSSGGEEIDRGRVMGVDDDGGLIFLPEGESEAKTVSSGEVTLRRI